MSSFIIVWFRADLRLTFNPAFAYALSKKIPILPVYIHCPKVESPWGIGGSSSVWLHHSLKAFQKDLLERGLFLHIYESEALAVFEKLIKKGAEEIVWNTRYEPEALKQEKEVQKGLSKTGCALKSFHGNVLFPPDRILSKQGSPYQVFTPFYYTCLKEGIEELDPLFYVEKLPKKIPGIRLSEKKQDVDDLELLPTARWDLKFKGLWDPGEKGAMRALKTFETEGMAHYLKQRDFPSVYGTSLLSPHLHFGEISPRCIYKTLQKSKKAEPFLRQILWREFAIYLLFHFPKTPLKPFKEKFNEFVWKKNKKHLEAWEKGMTGFPIIDAGMRQLWQTGWMHNRVRMIVASFLVKDLMIPWQEGAKWFWDTLVDADLANNTLGWQWCAGCGADAAPYFRIFNPERQSQKFDPQGEYIRKFVPELKKLSDEWIHAPHLAPQEVLAQAGIILGKTYPYPIVDHDKARKEALKAYAHIRTG